MRVEIAGRRNYQRDLRCTLYTTPCGIAICRLNAISVWRLGCLALWPFHKNCARYEINCNWRYSSHGRITTTTHYSDGLVASAAVTRHPSHKSMNANKQSAAMMVLAVSTTMEMTNEPEHKCIHPKRVAARRWQHIRRNKFIYNLTLAIE